MTVTAEMTARQKKTARESEIIQAVIAASREGDLDKAFELAEALPIHPISAKTYKRMFGKQAVLEAGWDLSEANARYGEGWLDEPDEK